MSEARLSRLEAIVEANTVAHQALSESLGFLVSEFIRPATQQAFSNFERLERVESALETLVAQSLVNAEQIEANHHQIANNTATITRLETKVDRIADTVSEQTQQIQILIDEGRADRQSQREALAAIISNGNRINFLEQRAS
ncbi:MAG: hypothetical protein WA885_05445 [Phormidesmis sp.]